jgi:hypothetical protein
VQFDFGGECACLHRLNRLPHVIGQIAHRGPGGSARRTQACGSQHVMQAALEAFGFQQAVGQVAAQFLRRHAIGAQRLEQQRNRRERRLELVSRGG